SEPPRNPVRRRSRRCVDQKRLRAAGKGRPGADDTPGTTPAGGFNATRRGDGSGGSQTSRLNQHRQRDSMRQVGRTFIFGLVAVATAFGALVAASDQLLAQEKTLRGRCYGAPWGLHPAA